MTAGGSAEGFRRPSEQGTPPAVTAGAPVAYGGHFHCSARPAEGGATCAALAWPCARRGVWPEPRATLSGRA